MKFRLEFFKNSASICSSDTILIRKEKYYLDKMHQKEIWGKDSTFFDIRQLLQSKFFLSPWCRDGGRSKNLGRGHNPPLGWDSVNWFEKSGGGQGPQGACTPLPPCSAIPRCISKNYQNWDIAINHCNAYFIWVNDPNRYQAKNYWINFLHQTV